jgi:hypothetical protein
MEDLLPLIFFFFLRLLGELLNFVKFFVKSRKVYGLVFYVLSVVANFHFDLLETFLRGRSQFHII